MYCKVRDLQELNLLTKERFVGNEPVVIDIKNPNIVMVNNPYTNFFFRIGYLCWVFKGANLLKPLQYYGGFMNVYTDDEETLRGAYGPRLRNWIGPDHLQEALDINQDIDNDEDYVKPSGVDQFEAVYRDLDFGMVASTMQIFDPAVDFEETNYVPDLQSLWFFVDETGLSIQMNYLEVDMDKQMLNDLWLFEVLKQLYAYNLNLPPSTTRINIGNSKRFTGIDVLNKYQERIYNYGLDSDNFDFGVNIEMFWQNFDLFLDFERHLRMQINEKTFLNEQVSIVELSNLLKSKLLDKIDSNFLKDLGQAMIVCAIVKNADNIALYMPYIKKVCENIKCQILRLETCAFIETLGVSLW